MSTININSKTLLSRNDIRVSFLSELSPINNKQFTIEDIKFEESNISPTYLSNKEYDSLKDDLSILSLTFKVRDKEYLKAPFNVNKKKLVLMVNDRENQKYYIIASLKNVDAYKHSILKDDKNDRDEALYEFFIENEAKLISDDLFKDLNNNGTYNILHKLWNKVDIAKKQFDLLELAKETSKDLPLIMQHIKTKHSM